MRCAACCQVRRARGWLGAGRVRRSGIWPIVVSMGRVMQTSTLWDFVRREMDPAKSRALKDPRVQPLQVLTIDDYEKVLGLVCAGHDLVSTLSQRSSGPFRERDPAAWLHGDPQAPSDKPRHPTLETRWNRMGDRAVAAVDLTVGLKADSASDDREGPHRGPGRASVRELVSRT
jgi:hypothetical protein